CEKYHNYWKNFSFSDIYILPSPSLSPLSAPRSIPPQALSPQVPSSQILSSQLLSSQILSPQVLSPRVASPQALSPRAPSPQAQSPQAPSPRAPSPQVPSPQAVLSPSSIWSTSDLESAFSGDSASGFSIEDDNKENSPSSLNVEEYSALTSKNILKTMQKVSSSTKKVCPEPDNFAKRRKKNDDLLMQAMTKQSTALTSFATKLGNSLVKSSPCSSTLSSASSENDPVLAAIGYALKSVPEEKRLECMIEILQVIKLKYIQ
ncbi:PREDICTED: neurofilament medium polypeptide-like, partial [Wasmannia auropunctata]|uniref:neurofilament medium polypeptide-like n=1 Tax=Wasmannia auropunctata TaxID=64793 RepID=UPI0005F0B1C6